MKPISSQAGVVVSLALPAFLASVGTSMANIALPVIASEFAAPISRVRWVVLIYLLMNTMLGIAAGRIGDSYGRRRVLLGGIAIFAVGALASGAAPTLDILVAGRALQGLGAAVLFVLPMGLIGESLPSGKSGRVIGLLASVSAIGTATGPTLGGLLVAEAGWRCVFLLMAAGSVASFISASLSLRASPRMDAGGALPAFRDVLPDLADVSLIKRLVGHAAVAAVMMSTLIVGPFFLSETLRLDVRAVGLSMSVGPFVSIITGAIAGRFVDRLGFSTIGTTGLIALLFGGGAFVFAAPFGVAGFVAAAAISSLGYQFFQAANSTRIMESASSENRGVFSGLLNFSRQAGLSAGAVLVSDSRSTYLTATVLSAAALALIFSIKPREGKWNKSR